jgi:hypothetical protein
MAKTRKLRTLRGGGTASWGFGTPAEYRTMNNPLAWQASGCGSAPSASTHLQGGGLPGLNQGPGVSLQRGGGGGSSYGFVGGGLAGGHSASVSNCAFPQSGASGVLNVPVAVSPMRTTVGGRRRKRNSRAKRNNSKNNRRNNNKSRRR